MACNSIFSIDYERALILLNHFILRGGPSRVQCKEKLSEVSRQYTILSSDNTFDSLWINITVLSMVVVMGIYMNSQPVYDPIFGYGCLQTFFEYLCILGCQTLRMISHISSEITLGLYVVIFANFQYTRKENCQLALEKMGQ
jgi:hypothetical protein